MAKEKSLAPLSKEAGKKQREKVEARKAAQKKNGTGKVQAK